MSHLKNVELHILSVCRKKREIKDKNDWLDKVEEENLIFSLEGKHLGLVNDKLHCTFKYHPTEKEIFNNLAGEYFDVYLIGYGNDGKIVFLR